MHLSLVSQGVFSFCFLSPDFLFGGDIKCLEEKKANVLSGTRKGVSCSK